jgi:hypothetical protein
VATPTSGRRGGPGGPTAGGTNKSAGRFPDGADTDSNCDDFLVQSATILAAASTAGANNIKVASVAGFSAGQTIMVDVGGDRETAVIATVGTAGATTVSTAANAGTTVVAVASRSGFTAGQSIVIDIGASQETAVVVSIAGGGRSGPGTTVTLAAPLTVAHAAGAQVSGTGITLTGRLSRAHASGAQIADNVPTPGAPNRYRRLRQ